jgi:hypothetical protein
MTLKYFDKETQKARQRFNQTFGRLAICDAKLRQAAIVGVGLLGCSRNRLQASLKGIVLRAEVRRFMRIRKALENVFDLVEEQIDNERRQHVQTPGAAETIAG